MSTPDAPLSPLDETGVQAALDAALAALARAGDLDELKAVRLAHAGDRSPLALANRAIGQLPAEQKALAGRITGGARSRLAKAFEQRQAELEEERDARVLLEEAVDVTLPVER